MQIRITGVMACALLLPTTYLAAQGRSGENNRSGQARVRQSRAQQALDSRSSLLSRAAAQTRSTPADLASRQARSPLSNPQTETGRLVREVARRRNADRRPSRTGRDLRESRSLRQRSTERSESGQRNRGRRGEFAGGQNRPTAPQADRFLARRLADIDHLRDVAVENGNERLLEQADRLEELARQQFENRTTGERLRANEIFRPMSGEEATTRPSSEDDVERPVAANRTRSDRGRRRGLFSFDFLRRAFRGRTRTDTE